MTKELSQTTVRSHETANKAILEAAQLLWAYNHAAAIVPWNELGALSRGFILDQTASILRRFRVKGGNLNDV